MVGTGSPRRRIVIDAIAGCQKLTFTPAMKIVALLL